MGAEVAGEAPSMPFWYYHFPDRTGVLPGEAHELLGLVDTLNQIPNFMGIMFNDYNLMDFQLCMQVSNGKYNMIYGRDEQALAAFSLGGSVVVSGTVQYSPTLRDTLTSLKEGDRAAAITAQQLNVKLFSYFPQFKGMFVGKSLMRM